MIITLLTDYGHDDEFVGVCHAVISGIAPDIPIVDLTHGIERFGVRQGAIVLRNSLPYVPVGVHVAIVDPQVGTERRGLALRTGDGRVLIGPDNGLLSPAWESCGGIVEAVDISRSPHRLEPVSATFHGRDIFAPVAAHLAAGAELADAGQHVDPDELQVLELPRTEVREGQVVAHVLLVDRFGNASLDVAHADLAGSGLTLGKPVEIEGRGPGGSPRRGFAVHRDVRPDVRRRPPGRGDPVRGLLPHAGRRGEPGRRRRRAEAHPRRDGRAAAAMIGLPRIHHRTTDSTNERAKQLAVAGAPHGTLVTADEQSAGRGRQGRVWTAPPGQALLMSLVVRGLGKGDELLPLVAAVAVSETCEGTAGVACRIKWPNDVWIDGRKVCGILVEGRPQEGWAVLGIGVNVSTREFPDELADTATSLTLASEAAPSREEVLEALTDSLDRWLAAPSADVLAAWRERDALLGAPVAWDEGRGKGAGITDAGALRVETDAGIVELDAGEVHLKR